MAEPSFSRSLEIKLNRFRWILMCTAILIFLRQEEQEHFFLPSELRFIDGEINFFHREMDTRSTISIPRWGDQRSLPEKGMSRSCCTSLFIDLSVFIIVPLSVTIVPRVEFGLNIDETWRILFARFFLLSTRRTWY